MEIKGKIDRDRELDREGDREIGYYRDRVVKRESESKWFEWEFVSGLSGSL